MQTNTIFSVFVENLSELNEGNMVGCWVEFPCDYDEWKKVLAKIGNPEEIIITDIDNYTAVSYTHLIHVIHPLLGMIYLTQ